MSRHGLIQGKYRHEDGLWDDLMVESTIIINPIGPPFAPDWLPFLDDGKGSTGTGAYWFDIDQYAHFTVQVPH
jgi:hypothetical protein